MFLSLDGTLIVQLVNFAIFFALLNLVFLRPVGRAIAKRRAYINSLASDYERYQEEARSLRAEAACAPRASGRGSRDSWYLPARFHVDMRQMARKRTALGAASVGACPGSGRVLPVRGRGLTGDGLLDVLERQLQLFGIELLRTPAELRTLQLAQQVPQPVILRQRLVALRTRGSEQRVQRVDVVGKLIRSLAHARHSTRFGCCRGAREAA